MVNGHTRTNNTIAELSGLSKILPTLISLMMTYIQTHPQGHPSLKKLLLNNFHFEQALDNEIIEEPTNIAMTLLNC